MIQINAAVFILIVEILAILAAILTFLVVVLKRRNGKKRKAVAQLVKQVKKQSEVRMQETGSFLQDIYQLEDEDLKEAVQSIDKSEKVFYQKLVNSYLSNDPDLVTSMDASVAGLIDVYKDLKPKAQEVDTSSEEEMELLSEEAEKLRQENEKLKAEVEDTKTAMDNMVGEFGNMFGGGSDHEMAKHEVVEKVEGQGITKDDETEK